MVPAGMIIRGFGLDNATGAYDDTIDHNAFTGYAGSQPLVEQPATPLATQQTSPPPPPPPPPSGESGSYGESQLLIQLRQELEASRAQLAIEREARIADEERFKTEKEKLAEYHKLQEEAEFQKLLSGDAADYVTLDPEDAKKLAQPLYNRLLQKQEEKYKALESKFEEQRKLIESQIQGSQKALKQENDYKVYVALEAAIPNFKEIVRSPAYAQFLQAPFSPGLNMSNQEVLNNELRYGNIQAVVEYMKRFAQGQRKDPGDIAQVSAVTTGVQASGESDVVDDRQRRKERLDKIRTGAISRSQFRDIKRGNANGATRLAT
jgi:hypothetical protein